MVNYPYIKKQCRACIHYVPMRENKYICGYDSKTYEVHPRFINEDGEITCSCHNDGFEYDEDKFKNVRY